MSRLNWNHRTKSTAVESYSDLKFIRIRGRIIRTTNTLESKVNEFCFEIPSFNKTPLREFRLQCLGSFMKEHGLNHYHIKIVFLNHLTPGLEITFMDYIDQCELNADDFPYLAFFSGYQSTTFGPDGSIIFVRKGEIAVK